MAGLNEAGKAFKEIVEGLPRGPHSDLRAKMLVGKSSSIEHGPDSAVDRYLYDSSRGNFANKKGGQRWKEFWGHGSANFEDAGGWGMVGSKALRGAIGGAAINGTVTAMNGGDFWDGAKAGAFKGATIYGGLHAAKGFTGAESLNPFAGGGRGALSSGYHMYNVTGGKNVKVSRAAAKILSQRKGDNLTRGVMNQ